MPETEIPAIVLAAARFWGGEGVTPTARPARKSRRDVDGGRYDMPAGWVFHADGFTYNCWITPDGVLHWDDGDPWGGYGSLADGGDHWLIDRMSGPERVPK